MTHDKNLTPLADLYRRHMTLGSDAEWEGKPASAKVHFKCAADIKRRMEDGETHEPNF